MWLFRLAGRAVIYWAMKWAWMATTIPFCMRSRGIPAAGWSLCLNCAKRMSKLRGTIRRWQLRHKTVFLPITWWWFVRVYKQQRVLVAINRGEACEVVVDDLPLLDVNGWQLKEALGATSTAC